MRRFLPHILLCLGFGSAVAQDAVENTSFAQAGDTIFYFTDDLPQKIAITAGGPDQNWNYANLKAPYLEYRVVAAASQGRLADKYQEAELVWQSSDGSERYIDVRDDGLWELGGVGHAPFNLQVQADFDFHGGLPIHLAKLSYGQDLDFEDQLTETCRADQLPHRWRKRMVNRYDSLKLETQLSRNLSVDAFGTLVLPGVRYEVIRARVEDYRSVHMEAKSKRGSWSPLPSDLADDLAGASKRVRYLFISVDNGKIVAEVSVDKDGKTDRVEFTMPDRLARYYEPATPGQWLYAYPNPAFSTVRFKFMDMQPGRYNIRFYNILGKTLMEMPFDLADIGTVEVSVGHLPKGTYLYSLIDGKGKKLITKRLIILKP